MSELRKSCRAISVEVPVDTPDLVGSSEDTKSYHTTERNPILNHSDVDRFNAKFHNAKWATGILASAKLDEASEG